MRNSKKLKRVFSVLEVPLLLALLGLILFQFTGAACPPAADTKDHILGYDQVDSGGHCDYDARYTMFATQVATATSRWNAHRSLFRPDSSSTALDLRIEDYYDTTDLIAGYTTFGTTAGKIRLNIAFLELDSSWTPNNKMHTIMHELGHALGLADHNDGLSTNVMKQGKLTNVTLTSEDKASFNAAAARY